MINRDEIKGTVTLSIADFDILTGKNNDLMIEFNKQKEKFVKDRKNFAKGLTVIKNSFFYGEHFYGEYRTYNPDYEELWLKENEVITRIEEKYKKMLKQEEEQTKWVLAKKTYWELIKWKRKMNKR